MPARRAVKPARGGRGGKGPKCAEADADPDELWDDLALSQLVSTGDLFVDQNEHLASVDLALLETVAKACYA